MAVQLATWTPIEVATPRKPEVLKIAATLGMDRHAVVGWLVEIWGWAGEQSVDGYVDAHVDAIELMLSAPKGFLRAMIAVGWLSEKDGGVLFPNADRWLSSASKSRIQKNIRQQKWRENQVPNVDADVDGSQDSEAPTRVEWSGIDNSNKATVVVEGHKKLPKLTSRIVPPPIADVIAHGARMQLPAAECQNFFDHYEASGWKRSGNTKISNWQAALSKWASNWRSGVFNKGHPPPAVAGKVVPVEEWQKRPYCAG